ncbi:hypothetical protein HPP92_026113 [Vanilla planifolia]|uniref:Uncharacterized protein n=1 Tax=Vanilla planifolia TaxID=51239 RepID=A0A835PL00_VANPL|nr:hypothetical protein HPP92_026113 [Vanilla planifolia]
MEDKAKGIKRFEVEVVWNGPVELYQALMTDITIMNGQLRFTTGCDEWTVDGITSLGHSLKGFKMLGDEKDLEWMGERDKAKGIKRI